MSSRAVTALSSQLMPSARHKGKARRWHKASTLLITSALSMAILIKIFGMGVGVLFIRRQGVSSETSSVCVSGVSSVNMGIFGLYFSKLNDKRKCGRRSQKLRRPAVGQLDYAMLGRKPRRPRTLCRG